jgi:hypothetical protein
MWARQALLSASPLSTALFSFRETSLLVNPYFICDADGSPTSIWHPSNAPQKQLREFLKKETWLEFQLGRGRDEKLETIGRDVASLSRSSSRNKALSYLWSYCSYYSQYMARCSDTRHPAAVHNLIACLRSPRITGWQ